MALSEQSPRVAGHIYDGTHRLAGILAEEYAVEKKLLSLHTDTLVSITAYSDGMPPSAVRFPGSESKRLGIIFINTELDRKLTVWLGTQTRGDVTIETPDGIRIASDKHFERYFTWLLEGMPKRNHARLKMLEVEAKYHPPFACGWYQESENAKQKRLPLDEIIRKKTIRELYDRFRKIFPDKDRYILVINALKRTANRPNDIGEERIEAKFLEKAFYHGG